MQITASEYVSVSLNKESEFRNIIYRPLLVITQNASEGHSPNVAVQWLELLHSNREVTSSNVKPETGYPD